MIRGTTINADATQLGNGGRVIVWSNDTTTFAGRITARGGAVGGDGGFAEVSGKQTLHYTGLADLSAPSGSTGTLLLDPTDFTIGTTEAATIVGNLATANVVVATDSAGAQDGNVTINAPVVYSSANDFAVLAHGDILVNASVQNDGQGDVSLVAGWNGVTEAPGGSGIVSPAAFNFANITAAPASYGNAKLSGGNGSIYIGDGTQTTGIAVGSRYGASNFAAAAMTLLGSGFATDGFAQAGFHDGDPVAIDGINGPITIALSDGAGNPGDLTATGGATTNSYVQVGHGGAVIGANNDPDGDNAGDISILIAGNISFTGGIAAGSYAQLGHGGTQDDGFHSGNISIVSANDISFTGGSAGGAYAQLGHNGLEADGGSMGNTTITQANNITFAAGSATDTYAQLGGGGRSADGGHSGDILIASGQRFEPARRRR